MPVALYMDHHVPKAITTGLRLREVDVLTSAEDSTTRFEDPDLLDRATELGRVLFTRDDDLLAEATRRQADGVDFAGVIFARQKRVSIGTCVRDLEIIAVAGELDELRNRVTYLPI